MALTNMIYTLLKQLTYTKYLWFQAHLLKNKMYNLLIIPYVTDILKNYIIVSV